MADFRRLTEDLGAGTPPAGWTTLVERPLVVVVGLTGVGKTTTLGGLDARATPFIELPNRRWLTDEIMIPAAAADLGVALPVTDRAERFRMTARYRETHPGGMAELLTALAVPADASGPFVFDGIRGANEADYAAKHLPNARFCALVAPDAVRLTRLLIRADPFDGGPVGGGFDRATADNLLRSSGVIPQAERPDLLDWLAANHIGADDLKGRLDAVAEERRNYDPDATVAALRAGAGDRLTVVDTTVTGPADAARALAALLG
ncbi:MAG: ATPase [Alphaproteobacteria bacterium]